MTTLFQVLVLALLVVLCYLQWSQLYRLSDMRERLRGIYHSQKRQLAMLEEQAKPLTVSGVPTFNTDDFEEASQWRAVLQAQEPLWDELGVTFKDRPPIIRSFDASPSHT